ncbi:SMI1/KNR4 family protein [Vitreoscilla stercoraria]|uniref:SMI1/KNR4 family protein n=1 Tax=Vitreoscilla stercoraria TaxID=61 RepID=A0ABY4E950_VITST|nr:SMI1/KNR4 family protein [Vitreoscilla stercoraria]UOO91940.1 SMI1/KNR4 family protein [Vitreoscilla stercoraria]
MKRQDMLSLAERLYQAIHQASHNVVAVDCFQLGVTPECLDAAAQQMDMVLPEDFKALYQVYNGDNVSVAEYFYVLAGYEWLSLERVVAVWQDFKDAGLAQFEEDDLAHDSRVRPVFWSEKWLPFADDNGYYLMLDLDPAEGGEYGQVILLANDGEPVSWIAPSLSVWLASYIEDLHNKIWVFDVDYHGMILASERADYQRIEHEKSTQTGCFDPNRLAQQAALMQQMSEQVKQLVPEAMWAQWQNMAHMPLLDMDDATLKVLQNLQKCLSQSD